MEDHLAVHGAHDAPRGGYGGGERDESEEEKVYYGFGVFMGLPLADLRAMKEEYLQNQQNMQHQQPPVGGGGRGRVGNGNGNHSMAERGEGPIGGAGVGAIPMRGPPPMDRGGGGDRGGYGEYEVRDPMGRSHGMVRDDGNGRGPRAMPPSMREMDPRMMAERGGPPMMQQQHPHYGAAGMRAPGGRRGMEYDASVDGINGGVGGGHHSDEGESSDGSYSGPKSHSLNFILH